ncbi:MAG: amino acid permease [Alphaproteobacteria bacterium]|nr:amino acid permease [Alphaproteobacteria bacterium]MDD9919155.1 amino acid permease [Alphaproteobacteria bacterium]
MDKQEAPKLERSLSLTHLILYGLGVTIGAGIYVLIGETTREAGIYAPTAFLISAFVMVFTASSFAEFSTRLPVSAGEAAYINAGFHSRFLSLLVGLGVASAGAVSAATISIGSVGYIREFVDLPEGLLITIIICAMGIIAIWGILESITLAALFTLVEIGGLLLVIGGGFLSDMTLIQKIPSVFPPLSDLAIWVGISSAGLLAFFAFIGFEDLVNIAEEAKNPKTNMPRAIFLTLGVSTLLYFFVVSISVLLVPLDILSVSKAPLSLVVEQTVGISPSVMTLIAIIATINGVIIQMIMASRVIYGLSKQKELPAFLSYVSPTTRTPLASTFLVVAVVLTMALLFPLGGLAKATSIMTLTVFALVNLALFKLKLSGEKPPEGTFVVWTWVPAVGFLISLAFVLLNIYTIVMKAT